MIIIPPKVWRPKVISRYIPVNDLSDIDEGISDYKQYEKAVFRPISQWKDIERHDMVSYNENEHRAELETNIRIGKDAINDHKSVIIGIVKKYWDFFKKGARRPILNYESSIDTGITKPVCCKNLAMDHMSQKLSWNTSTH